MNDLKPLRGGSFQNSKPYGAPCGYHQNASFPERADVLYSLRLVVRQAPLKAGDPCEPPASGASMFTHTKHTTTE